MPRLWYPDIIAESSLRFSDYADRYIREKGFADNYPETLRAYAVGLHNEKRVDALLRLAARADALADIVPEDDGVATECMEVHRCIFELKHVFQGDRGLLGEWEKIAAYYLRLPADSDNADILFETGVTMVDTLTKKRLPGRLRKVNAVLEGAYPLHRSARHAGQLAICLANEHACNCHIYIESDGPDAAEAREAARKAMESCLSALTRLLEEHPEEQKVITGYAVARSTQLYIVNGHDTDVTHDECLDYKRWFAQHPDDIDFAESYSRMLHMRFETLLRQGDTRAARRCVEEVRRIGRDARLEEYLDADAEEFFEMADAMNSLL